MAYFSGSPPRVPPIQYATPLGTRWAKEKASAGSTAVFDLPTDPKTVGPWVLGECVGRGASGRVKIAKHRRTGQLAAVKILPLTPMVSSRHPSDSQQAKCEKQRLGVDREIAMMKLMNHPNIMRIYDVFEGEMELFLVLEYVQGGELFDFLVNKGRLPPGEALEFFKQIIYGLNYAHSFSIIHRDLKPENILIASLKPPLLKIADWGMAAFALPSFELETSCGSPHYASPEIINGEKYQGTATDIWSCGVILFALLTGRLPFDDKNIRHLLSKVKAGKFDIPNWVDPMAKDLLIKMLVVDAKKRITIPEILLHPWLTTSRPTYDTPESSIVTPVPPLPPSPSQLAQPIPSPEVIDQELLTSLRVIWGKHTDPQGDGLIQELCSPPGYGTYAKAFYFLLGHYREEATRKRLIDISDDCQEQPNPTEERRQKFKTYRPRNLTYPGPQEPLVLLPVDQPSRQEDEDQYMLSPDGPQSPLAQPCQDDAPILPNQLRLDLAHISPRTSVAAPTRPPPVLGNGRGGPRPHPARRAKTHFSYNAVGNNNASGIEFAQNLQTLHHGPSYGHRSSTQRSSVNLDIRSRGRTQDVLCPPTTPRNSVVQRPTARTSRYADDQVADIFSGPTHHLGECFGPVAARRSLPQTPTFQENRRERAMKNNGKGYQGADKENQSLLDEGWSYISAYPDQCSPGRGINAARDVGNDVGNLPQMVMRGRKERKKERPPPLNLSTRNSFNILGSPTKTPPAAQSTPSRNSLLPVTSPAVEEFKGWLSNLFNWKSTGQGVFYSVYDISRTRQDISLTLESFGITLESTGSGGLDSGQTEGLRCRLDQGTVDYTNANVWKPVKFRIEFSTGSSDSSLSQENTDNFFCSPAPPRGRVASFIGKSMSSTAPLPTPALANSIQLPSGYASAVILVYEKGSITTFKAIWKRLKELYEDTPVLFRRLSPTLSPTPVAGNIQRLALN